MNIKIDYNICTKCGLCSKVCGSKRIIIREDKSPFKVVEAGCSDCGHCIAICPEDAICNTRTDMDEYSLTSDPGISTDQFIKLVRNRRSIRNFRNEPLKKEHIARLLEAVKYIPTGSNKQSLKYKLITDTDLLDRINLEMGTRVSRVSKIINSFPLKLFVSEKNRTSMMRLTDLFFKGSDNFLRNAPCLLIIFTEEKYFRISQWDAGIASNTIDLTAQTLGIGTLMNGYFVVFARKFRSLKKLAGLSGKQTIHCAMCLGYPSIRYRRNVYRRPLEAEIV